MSGLLDQLVLGFGVALTLNNLLYCTLGVTLGMIVGVIPGIGTIAAISLLFPLTFKLDITAALIMLAGIYYGAAYGGSVASILLNLPGTANTAVTCLDGYPMARQGRAGVALFITSIASFAGSMLGLAVLVLLAPALATVALSFGPAEYAALMVLGLLAAALLSSGTPFRALAMVTFGLIIGLVGTDVNTGVQRYTFSVPELFDGISLVSIAMGIFGVPEVIRSAGQLRQNQLALRDITWRSMLPTRDDWRRTWAPMLRGGGIGGIFGALPGTGGSIATFISYALEKRLNREPERFGKGAIEGIAAPESANNAAIQTAFIPTLTLGIPGDAVMALLLGVFLIHGVVPGPTLIQTDPSLFWGLVASFVVGNVILIVWNIPLIRVWVLILSIPYRFLFPAIIAFVCVGVYSVELSTLDILLVSLFGFIGYVMLIFRMDAAPLILGLILGPMLEVYVRRALLLGRGDPLVFVQSPLSAGLVALTTGLILLMLAMNLRRTLRRE